MKKLVLLIFTTLYALTITAQNDESKRIVSFINKVGSKDTRFLNHDLMPTFRERDLSSFKGIPYKEDSKYAVYSICVAPSPEGITECSGKLCYYIGINEDLKTKNIIIDNNTNLDFVDDSVYSVPLSGYELDYFSGQQDRYFIKSAAKVTYYNGEECVVENIGFYINPFSSYDDKSTYPDEDSYYLDVQLATNRMNEGRIVVDGEEFTIYGFTRARNAFFNHDLNKNTEFRFFKPNDTKIPATYVIGDTTLLGGFQFKLDKIDNNRLYLKKLQAMSDSCNLNDYLPQLYAFDIHDNQKTHLNPILNDKYVLIDFWGSWCIPCIKTLPKLVELAKTVQSRDDVCLIGIALEEHEKDLDRLKALIKNNGVSWNNYWIKRKDQKNISTPHGKLKIERYPSYFIIDKSGKIVFTPESTKDESVIDFFTRLINE
jgi:thiol-disulfide isomerase/thioredoxin